MHNVRQYKIELTADAPNIDIVALKNFGVWMNPYDKFYVLTLTDAESPYTHSQRKLQGSPRFQPWEELPTSNVKSCNLYIYNVGGKLFLIK